MRLYLDTEFNGFGGELISLALVPEDSGFREFYCAVEFKQPVDPWVAKHVIPVLRARPTPREQASALLAAYVGEYGSPTHPTIVVADWPTDFEHLLALLITGPGAMHPVPDFAMEFKRLPGFHTAGHSASPHNALADARALRDYCERLRSPVPVSIPVTEGL